MLIKRSNRTSDYYTVCLLWIGKSKLQSNFAFIVNSTQNAGIWLQKKTADEIYIDGRKYIQIVKTKCF